MNKKIITMVRRVRVADRVLTTTIRGEKFEYRYAEVQPDDFDMEHVPQGHFIKFMECSEYFELLENISDFQAFIKTLVKTYSERSKIRGRVRVAVVYRKDHTRVNEVGAVFHGGHKGERVLVLSVTPKIGEYEAVAAKLKAHWSGFKPVTKGAVLSYLDHLSEGSDTEFSPVATAEKFIADLFDESWDEEKRRTIAKALAKYIRNKLTPKVKKNAL